MIVRAGTNSKSVSGTMNGQDGCFVKTWMEGRGWVPEKYVKISGEKGIAEQGYVGSELSAVEGEIVRVVKLESGWAWVTSMTDETGWIPVKNLKGVE